MAKGVAIPALIACAAIAFAPPANDEGTAGD
jgi:hypothetical protein